MRYLAIVAVLLCVCTSACPPPADGYQDAEPAVIMNHPISSAAPAAPAEPEQEAASPVVLPAGWNDDLDDACEEPEPAPSARLDGAASPTVCSRFCDNMRQLKCKEGNTPDGGKTCEQNCAHVTASKFMPFDPECAAHASSKTAARKCAGVACR